MSMLEGYKPSEYYKGWLVVNYPETTQNAYRSLRFYQDNVPTFTTYSTWWAAINAKIDESGECGEFTKEQYEELAGIIIFEDENTKSIEQQVAKKLHVLPFMPEPGPPLPKYVQEALGTEGLAAPISAYGRALSDYVLEKLKEFMGTNFVVIEDFEETGWASDSVMYSGALRHAGSSTEWSVLVEANFAWRQPDNIESVGIMFESFREIGGSWQEPAEELINRIGEAWAFDLAADEGIKASEQVSKFRETGW